MVFEPTDEKCRLLAEQASGDSALTPEEIRLRFKTLFGREMRPEEKRAFFLPDGPATRSLRTDENPNSVQRELPLPDEDLAD